MILQHFIDKLTLHYKFEDQNSSHFINFDVKNANKDIIRRGFYQNYKNSIIKDILHNLLNEVDVLNDITDINKLTSQSDISLFDINQYKNIISTTIVNKINYYGHYNSSNTLIPEYDFDFKVKLGYYIYLAEHDKTKTALITNQQNIDGYSSDIKRLENQIKLFSNDDFIKESIIDPCGICLGDYENNIGITKCRHIICDECVKILFKNKKSVDCPYCRTSLIPSDIKMVSVDSIHNKEIPVEIKEHTIESSETIVYNDIILKYGTKLAYLNRYLNELLSDSENRVIIFSQYNKMLKLVGNVLDEYSIKNLYLDKNIHSINKKIKLFKTDKSYRVIMLSSEKCASGNNLTEANHIIFVDVMNNDKNTTIDIEGQAIGRTVRIGQKKPVIVKRIIMENTIEEEFYNKNKYDMKIHQESD
jgi:SNF2 family DNA or RNA helicase